MSQFDKGTGIQRVVNNLYRSMKLLQDNILAIRLWGDLITVPDYNEGINISEKNLHSKSIVYCRNDKLLMADYSFFETPCIMENMQTKGVAVSIVIYDLLPVRHTDVVSAYFSHVFENWLIYVLLHASNILCVSKTVADDLIKYYGEKNLHRKKPLKIFFSYLGFDLPIVDTICRENMQLFVKKAPTLLMVGTVERKKNYPLALKSLIRLHENYPELQILIIGRQDTGYSSDEDAIFLLENDEVLQDMVLWIKDASDGELQWAYQNCAGLFYTSTREGFGLPIVEAAHFGLPILCSDVPIFREVAGEYATYFQPNVADICRVVSAWLAEEVHVDSRNIRIYTWEESARNVLDIINEKTRPYCIIDENNAVVYGGGCV